MKRRAFLKTAGAAAAAWQIVPRHVLGGQGKTPPSRKVNLAAIGAGGQAGSDLGNMADENILALCDVDDRRAADSFKRFPQAKRYKDFRVMLDEMSDKVDGVLVGTPDHTHAVAAMAAMKHGKHVYCEKPLAHSVAELRALRSEAKARKLVTQVGNQGHATESIRIFCEWIWDGAIGAVSEVHACCNIFADVYSQSGKLAAVLRERPPVPPELDWNLWQGPAAERPYHPAYVPWFWRGWMPYGTGALGDWVCHVVDPVFWALDLDMPTVLRAETDGYDPLKQADVYPAGSQVTMQFPAKGSRGPVKLVWYDGTRSMPRPPELEPGRRAESPGAVVVGSRGTIVYGSHGAGGVRIIPESKMQAYKRPEKKIPRCPGGNHHREWLDAIREGKQAGSPFEYGGRLSEVGLLGAIAIRLAGEELHYDEHAMRFTNSEAATRLLQPPYRAGWTL